MRIQNRVNVIRAAAAAALVVAAAGAPVRAAAQSGITTLHTFAENPKTPLGRLLELPDGRFIGTAAQGGAFNRGAILQYVRNTAGTLTATTLHSFNGTDGDYPAEGGLVLGTDGHLYGSTCRGGPAGHGTLFRLSAAGQLTSLYAFQGPEGQCPNTALVQGPDGHFYGTTSTSLAPGGGESGPGTIFRLTASGTFTSLRRLTSTDGPANVSALFRAHDGSLYGLSMDDYSASPVSAAVFRMNLEGAITIVHRFVSSGFRYVNSILLDADGSFYGIAGTGVSPQQTVLFRLTTTGSFTLLHPNLTPAAAGLVRRSDGTFYFRVQNEPDIVGGRGQLYRVRPGSPVVKVHQFSFTDGSSPNHLIVASDNSVYGATSEGGFSRRGVIFRLSTTDAFSVQHAFSDVTPLLPLAGLTEGNDGALYGTSCQGGIFNAGTIFRVTPAGLDVLRSFAYWDGMCPAAALIKGHDGALYGTTAAYGLRGGGSIFRVTTGGDFTLLHFFSSPTWQAPDGMTPFAALLQTADGSLFGTTISGGHESRGTVFALSTGGAFTRLHSFDAESSGDGSMPASPLIAGPDGALYGATVSGGAFGQGTFFKIDSGGYRQVVSFFPPSQPVGQLQLLDGDFYGASRVRQVGTAEVWGSVFRITPAGAISELHAFTGGDDGKEPLGGITVGADGALFGTTRGGGPGGAGTIFRLTREGSFSRVHGFSGADGSEPFGALLQHSNGALYGTTLLGGPGGNGTVFVVSPVVK